MGRHKRTHEEEEPVGLAGSSRKRRTQASLAGNSSHSDTMSTTQAILNYQPTMNFSKTGKILKINLQNFMCHSNFKVDFNSRINLLVGNNGSGKSAILTALVVGLGSKASATNRSSQIQSLIKHGEASANIEIHIYNGGEDAYEPETYGDEIVVVRNITRSGSSKYKLKNEIGNVISTSKAELEKMMFFMNIQVDNPVCVLNQEAARSFLKDSNPKKNYQLFMRATQLQITIEKLNECALIFDDAKQHFECQIRSNEMLQKLLKETEETYRKLQSVENIKTNLKLLKSERLWLAVANQELFCEEIEKVMTTKTNTLQDWIGKRNNRNENDLRQQIVEMQQKIDELKLSLNCNMSKSENLRHVYEEKNDVLQTVKGTINKLESRKERFRRDIEQLEHTLLNRSDSHIGQSAKLRKMNEEKLKSLKKRRQDLELIIGNAKKDIQLYTGTKQQMEEEFNGKKDDRKRIVLKADQIQKQIQHCRSSSAQDTLSVYGNYMPALVNEIKKLHKRGKFSELPRGPIGQYIEVLDEKWKSYIELTLRSTLSGFLVNNANDRIVLTDLITKQFPAARRLPIYTGAFLKQVYDIRSGLVQKVPNTEIFINLIKVSDPVVMNCLIDYCKIESILLCEDENLTMRLTSDVENVPNNLLKIILLNPGTEFFPAPNYRTYAIEVKPARYLQVNMGQRKTQLEHELRRFTSEQKHLEGVLTDLQTKLKEMSHRLNTRLRDVSKCELDLNTNQSEINILESVEYPPDNEEEVLNNELSELRNLMVKCEQECESTKCGLETMEKKVAFCLRDMNENKAVIKQEEDELERYQSKYNQLKNQLDENSNYLSYIERKIAELNANVERIRVELNEAYTKKDRLTATALKSGARISSEYTTDEDIADKMKEMERDIHKVASTNQSIEVVEQLLRSRRNEYTKSKEVAEALDDALNTLRKGRRVRYNILISLKQHISFNIQNYFNQLMSLRNYNGEIKIDPKNETLELSVVPRDKHIKTAVSSAQCLSGGERSYSTVAFLIALWSCVHHPFYFLDEYDVFTDQVNRLYMTKLLIGEAKKRSESQYTFLTPQDISDISASEILTILRLADPERRN